MSTPETFYREELIALRAMVEAAIIYPPADLTMDGHAALGHLHAKLTRMIAVTAGALAG